MADAGLTQLVVLSVLLSAVFQPGYGEQTAYTEDFPPNLTTPRRPNLEPDVSDIIQALVERFDFGRSQAKQLRATNTNTHFQNDGDKHEKSRDVGQQQDGLALGGPTLGGPTLGGPTLGGPTLGGPALGGQNKAHTLPGFEKLKMSNAQQGLRKFRKSIERTDSRERGTRMSAPDGSTSSHEHTGNSPSAYPHLKLNTQAPGRDVSGSQQAPGRDVSGSQQAPGRDVSGSQQAPGRDVSGSQQAPGRDVSGSQQAPGRDVSGSQQAPVGLDESRPEIVSGKVATADSTPTDRREKIKKFRNILELLQEQNVEAQEQVPLGEDIILNSIAKISEGVFARMFQVEPRNWAQVGVLEDGNSLNMDQLDVLLSKDGDRAYEQSAPDIQGAALILSDVSLVDNKKKQVDDKAHHPSGVELIRRPREARDTVTSTDSAHPNKHSRKQEKKSKVESLKIARLGYIIFDKDGSVKEAKEATLTNAAALDSKGHVGDKRSTVRATSTTTKSTSASADSNHVTDRTKDKAKFADVLEVYSMKGTLMGGELNANTNVELSPLVDSQVRAVREAHRRHQLSSISSLHVLVIMGLCVLTFVTVIYFSARFRSEKENSKRVNSQTALFEHHQRYDKY
ncbi:uncharacterized protein LOC131937143 isoform X2 [Physella acuta]|uniref:uncharacterized protein LOC131937143 isoform X2 n=1 Tax=Physella acuta TaxID=109671 RepID=UPI0027DC4B92|nr:uncharacterized protein LOC131937143 isoform X2 [Physella acuta]